MQKKKSGLYIENLLDNYVSGYPVLICAALESIAIGKIHKPTCYVFLSFKIIDAYKNVITVLGWIYGKKCNSFSKLKF